MTQVSSNGPDNAALCPTIKKLLKFLVRDTPKELALQLAESEQDVSTLTVQLGRDVADISRTLRKMHRYTMVKCDRRKRNHVYSLDTGLEVILDAKSVHLKARAADGGQIELVIPRIEIE